MRLDTISLSALSRGFAIVLAVSAFLLAFAMGLGWRQVAQLQVDLETVAAQTEAKTVWFATLQRTLGYGGLIHQFEELVLRRDPALVEETQAHLDRARAAIGAYAAEGLSQREMALVEDLNSVLGNYEKSLATVTGLLADGASSAEIHRRTRVEDALALEAIEGLERELATMRARSSERVGEVVAQLHSIAKLTFFGGAGFLLLATIGVFWFAERRLSSPIADLVAKAERLSTGDLRPEREAGAVEA